MLYVREFTSCLHLWLMTNSCMHTSVRHSEVQLQKFQKELDDLVLEEDLHTYVIQ